MLTVLFTILMFAVFGKLLVFGIKVSWGLAKILCTVVLLPIVLIGLVIAGFLSIALPILVIIGVITLLRITWK